MPSPRVYKPHLEPLEPRVLLAAVSPPALLQWFEGSYETIERRVADVFTAGYGGVYLPPPGRADSGDFSVGYDVYDRFDLGRPERPTLYGTENGLRGVIEQVHAAGGDAYIDYIINHNGFSDADTPGFAASGGYPGFFLQHPFDNDGDFHPKGAGGDIQGRLAGLIDINHAKNHTAIRHPVPGLADNLPAGTVPHFGRLANVPDEANRAFYPDQALDPIRVFDPQTGETDIAVFPFNRDDPGAGDPVVENATGYLMRYAQWMVQVIGVDGFRIDAAKHVEPFALEFFDRGVYRSSPRTLLDGSQKSVFSFSEVFAGDRDFLQSFVRDDINPADPGRIGGNRDVLDFSLFFALGGNLTDNGLQNDWNQIRNAPIDVHDDGLHNGSQGVMFVNSHDEFGPALSNVAHAYVLMHPGNAVVYFNGKEFGNGRDFPKDGRGDALGGLFGDAVTRLLAIRESHGRGDYIERWLEKELFAYERDRSAVVLLSNRTDGGFDSRTLQTNFPAGTPLIELTGNAADPRVDPNDDLPELVVVNQDGTINVRFPRNRSATGEFHGNGYLIYGPSAPQGSLTVSNVSHTVAGGTPTGETNGSTRLAPLDVISSDAFEVTLQTEEVNLLGSVRDASADGDNALVRIDGGLDFNNNGTVDFVQPNTPSYGFERFVTKHSPRWGGGDGEFRQTVDATRLSEGYHYLTARAFRHREPAAGEPVYEDFKKVLYVDRLPPESAIAEFPAVVDGVNENRRLIVESTDNTADNVHVFFDLPAATSDAEIRAMLGQASQTDRWDRAQFKKDLTGVSHGNHVATVVTFEVSGNVNIQRFPGLFTSTVIGGGLGDVDLDGNYTVADVTQFEVLLNSDNTRFHAAADLNGDGRINYVDLVELEGRLAAVGAGQDVVDAYEAVRQRQFSAVDDGHTTDEDQLLRVAAAGVLTNDRDPGEGANVRLTTTGTLRSAAGADVTLNADGSFDYDPLRLFQTLTTGQEATDSFTYIIDDGHGRESTGTVTLTVAGRNDAPTFSPPDFDASERTPLTLSLFDFAADIDGTLDGLSIIAAPSNGTLQDLGNGTLVYESARNYFGVDTLQVQVTDNQEAASDPATISIQVARRPFPWQNPVNRLDVTDDGRVAPVDVLASINDLNANSSRDLPVPALLADAPAPYLDVNGDGKAAPVDTLIIVNHLNESGSREGEGAGTARITPASWGLGFVQLATASVVDPVAASMPRPSGQIQGRDDSSVAVAHVPYAGPSIGDVGHRAARDRGVHKLELWDEALLSEKWFELGELL